MMRIIPAIDIINGECVRLSQGDYSQKKIYSSDPVFQAREFEKVGCKYLHLVDLDGARMKSPQNLKVLKEICAQTGLIVDFGGGVKGERDLNRVLDAGAAQVTVGSLSVSDPGLVCNWLSSYGVDKIIVGADVKEDYIYTHGWKIKSDRTLIDFVQFYYSQGAEYFVCTDIDRDGMLKGSSIKLYQNVIEQFPEVKLIASGGIRSIDELKILSSMGLDGAIIGKSLYEGYIQLDELQNYNEKLAADVD